MFTGKVEDPLTCCSKKGQASSSPIAPNINCFIAFTSPQQTPTGCTDPIPILTNLTSSRCRTSGECKSELEGDPGEVERECVIPRSTQIMRLTVQDRDEPRRVLLWSGPKNEIKDQGSCYSQFIRVVRIESLLTLMASNLRDGSFYWKMESEILVSVSAGSRRV